VSRALGPILFVLLCITPVSVRTFDSATAGPVQTSNSVDETAIREVVRLYASAREASDPQAIEALFVADADQLVSSGEWRRGRSVLVTGALASSARTGGTRTLEVEAVRMVAPDVAIADARYVISGIEGTAPRRMWSTFVMVRQQGTWRISAIRNMLPAGPVDAAPTPR
jgi:uncharacterized protein (TIGR02246 family)